MNLFDECIQANLTAIIKDPTDRANFLTIYHESGRMSKLIKKLSGEYYQDPFLIDMIKAWQNQTRYSKLVEFASLLAQKYTLPQLLKFNRPAGQDGQIMGPNGQPVLFFEPQKMTEYLFTRGKKHYKENGHPLAPISSPKFHRRHYPKEQLHLLLDMFCSSEVLDNVAYDTYYDPRTKQTIPKFVRKLHDANMIKLMQNLCKENGLKIPCRSTCQKIINVLPAAKPKMMRGVNPSQDEAMVAFDSLRNLANKLGQATGGMSAEERTSLLKSIDTGHQYLRSHLAYNIKEDANCPSHCFTHACSDPKNPKFSSPCNHSHDEACFQCNNLFFILAALEMAIERSRNNGNSIRDCDEMKYDLEVARKAIHTYHAHLIRSACQNVFFDKMKNEYRTDTVYVHQDTMH